MEYRRPARPAACRAAPAGGVGRAPRWRDAGDRERRRLGGGASTTRVNAAGARHPERDAPVPATRPDRLRDVRPPNAQRAAGKPGASIAARPASSRPATAAARASRPPRSKRGSGRRSSPSSATSRSSPPKSSASGRPAPIRAAGGSRGGGAARRQARPPARTACAPAGRGRRRRFSVGASRARDHPDRERAQGRRATRAELERASPRSRRRSCAWTIYAPTASACAATSGASISRTAARQWRPWSSASTPTARTRIVAAGRVAPPQCRYCVPIISTL